MNGPTAIVLSEVRPVFETLLSSRPLALAVSGGADSMALMHLVADWIEADRPGEGASATPTIVVVTVDHGLRPGSAEEARFVAGEAAGRGLPHVTLPWAAPKPTTGIQDSARAARYRLLAAYVIEDWERRRAQGSGTERARCIVTAHHLDDVAETLVLRLARGSGVRGLSSMAAAGPLPLSLAVPDARVAPRVELRRPLLEFAKERLVATLTARGAPWIEDASNRNLDFERVRVRQARAALEDLGLGNAQLALSARRLQRAAEAIGSAVDDLADRAVNDHAGTYCEIALAAFVSAPSEVQVQLLERVIAAHGGQSEPARLSQIEALWRHIHADRGVASPLAGQRTGPGLPHTLGGCLVERVGGRQLLITRELRGNGLQASEIRPGDSLIWDHRFFVSAAVHAPGAALVRALGREGWDLLVASDPGIKGGIPARAAVALPSFWRDDHLLWVPYLAAGRATADGVWRSVDHAFLVRSVHFDSK